MDSSTLQHNLDTIWILTSAALVFFMQAGFSCLETGLVRAKNSINVAIKNVSDLVFSMVGYWLMGFGLMFGTSFLGLSGITGFGLVGFDSADAYTFFLFQAVFAGTAVTIVSGALAERVKFNSYLTAALVIGSVIYPLFGHWAWGGAFLEGEDGWLKAMGFHDFAGSTVVHSIGGWAGLAGALFLGPRFGRFDEEGKPVPIPGFNLALAALGVFILWFGWFGFNGGSTLTGDASVAKVLVNTNISAAMGGLTAFMISLAVAKRPLVEKLLNGILGGLVGITAGCDLVTPLGAACIGLGSGCVVYFAEDYLLRWGVDDPVGAVAAHGFCGAFGTLILAFVAPASALPTGSPFTQLGVQALGVSVAFVWSFGSASLLFWLLKEMGGLRVSQEDEIKGLNISEHGARMSWVDTVATIKYILDTGDMSQRIKVETGTEMGEVAQSLNVFLDEVETAANVAHKVADGDLSTEVTPKSELDILGIATTRMVEGLRRAKLSRYQVMSAIRDIARTGDLSRRVRVDQNSEMAEVAQSFNDLLESILAVAEVARSVSKGDLGLSVTPKSDDDILARATQRMVESLRTAKFSRESVIKSIRAIVATGDLERRVTAAEDPEMAEVASSFNTLLAEILNAAQVAHRVANGDLSQKVRPKSDRDILGLAVNTMVESLHGLLAKVDGVARALSESVLQLDNSSHELEAANTDIVRSISHAASLVDRSIHAVQA
ncbi:MAG: ammonium transporter, partial [Desulfovibrio sp.]